MLVCANEQHLSLQGTSTVPFLSICPAALSFHENRHIAANRFSVEDNIMLPVRQHKLHSKTVSWPAPEEAPGEDLKPPPKLEVMRLLVFLARF